MFVGLAIRGRRSGKVFRFPVPYVESGNALVVAPGHASTKTWWRNLSGDPTDLEVLLRGSWQPARGEVVRPGDSDYDRLRASYVMRWPKAAPDGEPVVRIELDRVEHAGAERRVRAAAALTPSCAVALWWLPLGAGESTGTVRLSGLVYERIAAWQAPRPRQPLFHAALRGRLDGMDHVIEMAPGRSKPRPGSRCRPEGPVGLVPRSAAGRSATRSGAGRVAGSPMRRAPSRAHAEPDDRSGRSGDCSRRWHRVPAATWGLDELEPARCGTPTR